MSHPNLDLIDRFFAAYGRRNLAALHELFAEDAAWTFPGRHPLSGVKVGVDAIVAFFDAIGSVMGASHPTVERLVLGANDRYVVECQYIHTNRADGSNLDQRLCVLWSFADGKISSGQHLTEDQHALDTFYTAILERRPA